MDGDMFRMPASNGNDESPTTKHNNTHCPIITAITHNAVDKVSLGLLLWTMLQRCCKEDNGAAGNFYSTILLCCVGATDGMTDMTSD
jgi:hypothetical protein